MEFSATTLPGAFVIDIEPNADERGFFARTFCEESFAAQGLPTRFVQQSVSFNHRAGTVRGLHFQCAPHEEEKVVRVTRGAVMDIIVDLRRDSARFGRWFGIELSADNHRQLYIPRGIAHGFQTLADDTEVFYAMSVPFHPEAARGVRWDDPQIGIAWPVCGSRIVSSRDRALPLLSELT